MYQTEQSAKKRDLAKTKVPGYCGPALSFSLLATTGGE